MLEHHSGSETHKPDPIRCRLLCGDLPLHAEVGQEARARSGAFIQGFVAVGTVVADAGRADEDLGLLAPTGTGLNEQLGREDPALNEHPFASARPACICDSSPG